MDLDPPDRPEEEAVENLWNFSCRECGNDAAFPETDAGRLHRCPHCGAPGRVKGKEPRRRDRRITLAGDRRVASPVSPNWGKAGLALVLFSWFAAIVLALTFSDSSENPLLLLGVSLLFFLFFAGGTVVAVIGFILSMASRGPSGKALFYSLWALGLSGLTCILLFVGLVDRLAQMDGEPSGTEEVSDSEPPALPVGVNREGNQFRSPMFGYTVDVPSTRWAWWDDLSEDFPDAEFGVLRGDSYAFAVVPLWLGEHEPHFEGTVRALLQRLSVPFPDPSVTALGPMNGRNIEGASFAFEREVDGVDTVYRFRVFQRPGYAYLLAGWLYKKVEHRMKRIEEILDRVRFEAPPPAPDPASFPKGILRAHTLSFNDLGLYYYEAKDFERSVEYFRQAFSFERADSVILGNWVNTLIDLGRMEEASEILEANLARFPAHWSLQAKHAFVLSRKGKAEDASRVYKEVFDGGYLDDDDFSAYVELLMERGLGDEGLAEIHAYQERRDSLRIRILEASIFDRTGRTDKAVALLRTLQEHLSFHAEISIELANYLFGEGDLKGSLGEADLLIEKGFDSAYSYFLKGRAEYALKWYREAKASLETAAKKDPADEVIQNHLDHASGMLGEGANSSVKEKIDPVPFPPELLEGLDGREAPAEAKALGAWYLLRLSAVSFVRGKDLRVSEVRRIRVLNARGVSEFSTLQFPFDPLSEGIHLNELVVRNAKGELVSRGKVEDSYVIDDTSGGIARQRKVFHIPVPGLEPGHLIELTVTRRALADPDRMWFLRFPLYSHFPVLRAAVTVRGDLGALRARASMKVPARALGEWRAWVLEKPPVYRWEPYQPSVFLFTPMVHLNDDSRTWVGEVKNYVETLADLLDATEAVRDLAEEKTRAVQSRSARIEALARYVRDSTTYKALAFGRSAVIPHDPAEIARNKYGDCKDHSLLLHLLLKASGIPSQLALVNTRFPVYKDLPSLDQFDHMIVYVPSKAGGVFLDATDKDSAIPGKGPAGLAGQEALILDPASPRFVTIPGLGPGAHRVMSARTVRVVKGSDAEVRETLTFHGLPASGMRAYLKAIDPSRREADLQAGVAHRAGAWRLLVLDVEALEDPEKPLVLRMSYTIPSRFHAVGGKVAGRLPAIWERDYFLLEARGERWSPFRFNAPLRFESTVTVELPEGMALSGVEAGEGKGSEASLSWSWKRELADGVLRARFRLDRAAGLFSPEAWEPAREAAEKALAELEMELRFE